MNRAAAHALTALVLVLLSGCDATTGNVDRDSMVHPDAASVPVVLASVETHPVETSEDAADDPVVWVNRESPEDSLILGTDKRAGVAVYRLDGSLVQFVPLGQPNNIDLRHNVSIAGWQGDLAIASNRQQHTVTLLSVDAEGVTHLGDFASLMEDPYGACLGEVNDQVFVFVTYQSGELLAYRLAEVSDSGISAVFAGQMVFSSQLEGCVVDDRNQVIYIGEETVGIWKTSYRHRQDNLIFSFPVSVDRVGGASGIVADIEGLALYSRGHTSYLIASSQGNSSFAVYQGYDANTFIGRFRIGSGDIIDGTQETDGVGVSAAYLGEAFPEGVFVAQDGHNRDSKQNFKVVDWRDIRDILPAR